MYICEGSPSPGHLDVEQVELRATGLVLDVSPLIQAASLVLTRCVYAII